MVRDGLLGGRPSDIDVWLPSNISVPDQEDFRRFITNGITEAESIVCVFSGPGAHVDNHQNLGMTFDAPTDHEYGDVNNHWVFEVNYADMPKVNFMRSMTPWTNPQDFFNGLMRAFDIDQCMYFIGYEPGQQMVNSVIMPQHLAAMYTGSSAPQFARFRMNELYWNQYRMNTTSAARIEARIAKMIGKYRFNLRDAQSVFEFTLMLRTEEIVATAVPIKLLTSVNSRFQLVPFPTLFNRAEPVAVPQPQQSTFLWQVQHDGSQFVGLPTLVTNDIGIRVAAPN